MLPLTELEVDQVKSVKGLLKEIIVVDSLNDYLIIVTGHLHEWNNTWNFFICNVNHSYYARIVLSATCKHSKAVVRAYEELTGYKCCVQELRHRHLGGLTGSQLHFNWIGADGYKKLEPEVRRLENRSLTFLFEPVAHLAAR